MDKPYEFDSCISTEEAFFGMEESKLGGAGGFHHTMHNQMLQNQVNSGSNPQEDATPKGNNN